MKKIFITIIIASLSIASFSQYQAFKWYLGPNFLLDFSSTSISANDYPQISYSGVNITNATAIICDSNKNVALFLSDNDIIIPQTTSSINALAGNTSSPNQPAYFFGKQILNNFTVESFCLQKPATGPFSIFYSNGIIQNENTWTSDSINLKISDAPYCSKMAIYDNGTLKTLITHELNSNKLLIYNALPSTSHNEYVDGILYGANPGGNYDSGFMKFSNDAHEFAISSPDKNFLQLFQYDTFNNNIQTNIFEYSGLSINAIEFSLGSSTNGYKILYGATDYQIYQFIFNSLELIKVNLVGETNSIIKNMQVGVDGKIYVGKENNDFLGVIYNPEIQGVNCFYDDHAINKPAAVDPTFNGILPNIPANYFTNVPYMYWFDTSTSSDTLFANQNAKFYLINNNVNYINWNFGDGNNQNGIASITHAYNLPGVYNLEADVYYTNHPNFESQKITKKIIVNPQPGESILNIDTSFLCDNATVTTLVANYNPINFLVWKNGSGELIDEGTGMTSMNVGPGVYYLECYDRQNGVLVHKDTATIINMFPNILISPTNDINPNENINFNANITQMPNGAIDLADIYFYWDFGDGISDSDFGLTSINHTYTSTGTYSVTVSIDYNGECYTNTVSTIEVVLPTGDFIDPPEVELCQGGSEILTQNYGAGYYYEWKDINLNFIVASESINVYTGGYYILEVYDTQGGNLLVRDTATVYSLNPSIETNAINYSIYDNINFNVNLNPTPEYFVLADTLPFEWYFDDETNENEVGLTTVYHNYQMPQTYSPTVYISTSKCTYTQTAELSINDYPEPITPNDAFLCDIANPVQFEFIDDYQGYNCEIFYDGASIGTQTTSSVIQSNQAGEYFFKIFNIDGDTIAFDTITIYEYSAHFEAIGDDAMPSTTFNIGENIYLSGFTEELPYPFIDDPENIYYKWIFDDSTIATGFDYTSIDTIFYSTGSHNIKLQTTYNSCTKIFNQDITIVGQNDINIIFPQDTIICNNSEPITLSIGDEYNDYFIEWTKIDGSTLLAGYQETECQINEPGEIVVRIFTDEFAADTINSDTARIFQFAPNFSYSGSLLINEPIEFYSFLNPIPEFYNNFEPLYYTWDMGDGTIFNEYSLETINHTYTQTGNYEVNLTVSSENCDFVFTNNLLISGGAINVQITPEQPVLCNPQLGDEIELSVMPNNSLYFIWYHQFLNYNTQTLSTEIIAEDTNNVTVNRPGKYIVEALQGADVYYDTVLIDYKNCNIYDATLSINGVSGLSEICANNTTVDFDVSLTDQAAFCHADFDLFSYVWDFGDGSSESVTGNQYISHTYDGVGEFLVSLYIFDNKNCEKVIRKKIKIFTDADTAIIYQVADNVQGDIEIDLNNIPELYTDYYNKNIFISNINSRIIPFNSQSFDLNVTGSKFETIQSASDVMLYLKIAQIGDLKVTLKPPLQGTEIDVINTNAQPDNYLFGKPAIKNNNWMLSKTNSYILIVDNELPIQNSNGIYYNEYYSVDSIYSKSDFYGFKSGIYKSDALYNIQDEFVNGTWQLLIEGENMNYGLIESWGLIFNNEYFHSQIKPDSMVCTDQFGFEYNVVNDKIMLNNSGVNEYTLNCNLKYPNSSCEINKTIIVQMPDNNPIPEYFSPNGDGINDYWLPVSPDANAHIIIVDKNGNIVADYYSNENFLGWDGTFNGNPLPSDSYWFIITLANNSALKGTITIVR